MRAASQRGGWGSNAVKGGVGARHGPRSAGAPTTAVQYNITAHEREAHALQVLQRVLLRLLKEAEHVPKARGKCTMATATATDAAPSKVRRFVTSLATGGVAASISKTINSPFEVAKLILQTQPERFKGLTDLFVRLPQEVRATRPPHPRLSV